VATTIAQDADGAVEAWHTHDGEVALKAITETLVHRTDEGGVILRLADESAVRAAFSTLTARFGDHLTSVAVQPMVSGDFELLVGVVQDETFGPLVQVGAGGITTDVIADRSARLLPLTDRDAHEMLTVLRCWPLMNGFRGAPPLDIAAVEDVLARVARLASDLPQVVELDLNPLLVQPDGVIAVDLKLRVAPAVPTDPYLRRLR
jgi:acyl-CoA synthetase (NDP forming)